MALSSSIRRRHVSYALLGIFLIFMAYLGVMQLIGNLHTVVEGQVYRSAQLTPHQMEKYAKRYHIQSILNLRGDNTGKDWYDHEKKVAQRLGIEHANFRMSAKRTLTQDRAEDLIALMRELPKPMLIHCRAGADRSGLASALYIAAIEKGGEAEAEMHLTPLYGHIPLPFIGMPAMDETFENLELWLGYQES